MENDTLTLIALADELERFIQDTIPKSKKVSKYGGILFTVKPEEKEGQFCGVFIYTQHVQVSFSLGVQLKDLKKSLSGSGKFRRHINYATIEEVNFQDLKNLLIQSSQL